jgi:hypothetical protein
MMNEQASYFGSIEMTPERELEVDRVASLGFSSVEGEQTLVSDASVPVFMEYGDDDHWYVYIQFPNGRALQMRVSCDALTINEAPKVDADAFLSGFD